MIHLLSFILEHIIKIPFSFSGKVAFFLWLR